MAMRGIGSDSAKGDEEVDGCSGGWPVDRVPVVSLTAAIASNKQAQSASRSRPCQAVTARGSFIVRWLACSYHDDAGARPMRATVSALGYAFDPQAQMPRNGPVDGSLGLPFDNPFRSLIYLLRRQWHQARLRRWAEA